MTKKVEKKARKKRDVRGVLVKKRVYANPRAQTLYPLMYAFAQKLAKEELEVKHKTPKKGEKLKGSSVTRDLALIAKFPTYYPLSTVIFNQIRKANKDKVAEAKRLHDKEDYTALRALLKKPNFTIPKKLRYEVSDKDIEAFEAKRAEKLSRKKEKKKNTKMQKKTE